MVVVADLLKEMADIELVRKDIDFREDEIVRVLLGAEIDHTVLEAEDGFCPVYACIESLSSNMDEVGIYSTDNNSNVRYFAFPFDDFIRIIK